MMGETSSNIARNVDLYNIRVPLGVCAGIAAFNFPVMIPLWMFPVAITLGNTYILKPSEKVAGASTLLAQLLNDVKLPKGVVNVVHGGPQTVTNICTHPKIKAISFVGSNGGGEYVWETGTKHGKRVQSNMGAKNHGIILPDAEKEDALNQLAGAAFGASGQRCMALTCAVFVGESQNWIPELVEKAKNLKVGSGMDAGIDVGPLIDKAVCCIFVKNNCFRPRKESPKWSRRLLNKVLRSFLMELATYIPNSHKETSLLPPSSIT